MTTSDHHKSIAAAPEKLFAAPLAQHPFLDVLKHRVMVFDGGLGTQIFAANLTLADFNNLENCPEVLVLSRPDVIESIHESYYAAGADTVETDTFGASKIVLSEFGLQDQCREINRQAAQLARNAANKFSAPDRPRFVAGSIGPGTKAITLGNTTFEVMLDSYLEQLRGLLEGGVDAILIETCFDLLQAKVAVIAAVDAMRELGIRVPIMVQVTMETVGTMLLGTEINAVITTLEALPVDVIGMNCATGPELMRPHVESLSQNCTRYISVQPNAGLPVLHEGRTHFPLGAAELAKAHVEFVQQFGVNIVGGCCGTTPEHIRAVAAAVAHLQPAVRPAFGRKIDAAHAAVSSLYSSVEARQDNSILIIGERTNTNGSKKFRDCLLAADWDMLVAIGREQVKEGSHVVDVCVDYVGRNGVPDMTDIVRRFAKEVTAPLMIDSTQLDVVEAGLQAAPGKCIVNSINLEDGEDKLARMAVLLKRYGAAVVAGTIDEDKIEAMAKTADRKIEIAKRLYDLLVNKYGIPETDIYFDPLIFPVVTGQEEVRRLALETIDGIRRISTQLPNCHTTLGLSNVSFGLKPYARLVLNSAFFNECVKAGLTSAIVHASKILPQNKIEPEHYQWALDLIYDRQRDDYKPLQLLTNLGAPAKVAEATEQLPLEEKLRRHIIDGDKQKLSEHLDAAMQKYAPLEIINDHLLAGMKVVGDLFGSGQMQLPFVLQSAEVMKTAVAYLQPFMPKSEGSSRGRMVLATVKGDVHDIGKNLVDIILSNNGYTVINLGIKQPIANVIQAAREHNAQIIGLSGLLVKSTLVMRDDLQELNRLGIDIPVILGGAALTRGYVEKDLRDIYQGPLFYGKDAFEGLRVMDHVATGNVTDMLIQTGEDPQRAGQRCKGGAAAAAPSEQTAAPESQREIASSADYVISGIRRDAPVPALPFYGSRVVKDIPPDAVFPYVDEVALFRGQWQFKSGVMPRDDFRKWTESHVRPIYNRIKQKCRDMHLLQPQVAYGYFWVQADKNDLIVYAEDKKTERLRFHFPRQIARKRWCLSDFFRPVESGEMDVLAMQCVTAGPDVAPYEKRLFEQGDFTEYLYIHGIGVQMAEALAEMWHKRIRQELGIADRDGSSMRDIFACHFQGCRYSFGYPACPDLQDEEKLFALLDPARIGCTLSESWMIQPEQSTSAIIVHHPEARYFNVE
jgi:5-methyltetrahydrofolate--homocysteine methyltransferase